AGAGRAGSGVPPMGCEYRNKRSGTCEPSRTVDQGRGERPRYAAAAVLETSICVAGHGGADHGDCVRQHRESAAGAGGGAEALKETRGGERGSKRTFRTVSLSHALVVSQIAISLLMLVAAGLFVRTLSNLQSIQLGFNREDLLLFQMNARQAGHRDPEIIAFY